MTSTSSGFTGGARQLIWLANSQLDAGHFVNVCFRTFEGNPYEDDLRQRTRCDSHFYQHTSPLQGLQRLGALEPDIVHLHGEAYTLHEEIGSIFVKSALVVNIGHSKEIGSSNIKFLSSQRVSAIIAVCDTIKQSLISAGINDDKIRIVHSAVSSPFRAVHQRARWATSKRLLSIGTVYPYKGFSFLLHAMRDVLGEHPDAELHILGRHNSSHATELMQYVADTSDLSRSVFFHGAVEVTPTVMSGYRGLVNSSVSYEGIAGVIREAMSVGLPVIATRVGGHSELVENGLTGLLVPPESPSALADAMKMILCTTNERVNDQIASSAFSLARTFLGVEQKAAIIEGIYERYSRQRA